MEQIDNMLARPKRYANIDGLGELTAGIMCLGFAFFQWEQIRSPAGAVWHSMYLFAIYFGALIAALHYGPRAIKSRITYPRTGFVEYRKRGRLWLSVASGALAAAVSVLIWIAVRHHWDMQMGALIFLGIAPAYAYRFAKTARWKWAVAAAIAVSSLAIAFISPDSLVDLTGDARLKPFVRFAGSEMLNLAAVGVLTLISGAISLWLYLRHTQPPVQEAQ